MIPRSMNRRVKVEVAELKQKKISSSNDSNSLIDGTNRTVGVNHSADVIGYTPRK